MEHSLAHHVLLAMPLLQDPYFNRSLVYVVEHDENGAMGVVINKPVAMTLAQVMSNLEITVGTENSDRPLDGTVSFGGPVMRERGFVLHGDTSHWEATFSNPHWGLTTSRDILEALARGEGPADFQVCLGYAGWSAGQLEDEVATDAWLAMPANRKLVFETPHYERYKAAFAELGIDPDQISPGGLA